ncbi:hypothetical protein [Rhizomicrobium electricum]|uniref:Uncharacterized protein n=1 Tax=Rhizomicrobium electricum TaxID=480070 RepID=A0ABP3PXH0_9PROT|nr:hypothetical protein [Rhizomicrobium electricum]NIJ49106.1 hypothetical protein [Rhizomicrobium electricum]
MLRTAITFATALVLTGVVATPAAIALVSPHDAEFAPEFRMGYAFLKQYKTVWDYPNATLYLLKS